MGLSQDYSHIPDWKHKPEGYHKGEVVKYQGHIFIARFWASKPGEGNPSENGWNLYDELYDVTSSPTTEPARIIGYIPTWRKKEGFNYANPEMYRNITHGIISFLMFSEAELGEFDATSVNDVKGILNDVISTGHQCGTYILVALGGATDYGFLYLMERIGNNPADPLLQKAVDQVVNFIESNALDGVDLDLECWWDKDSNAARDQGGRFKSDGAHPAGKGLAEFAKQLRQAMPDKIISAALFATSWYGNCYDSGLVEYVDWLGLMTYDLTGSWNQSPVGPHTALLKIHNPEIYQAEQHGPWPTARPGVPGNETPMEDNPLHSVEESLWYWTNPFFTNWQGNGHNLSRAKIAAGVPIYGYDFAYGKEPDDLSGQVAPGYKVIRYKELLNQFPDAHMAENGNIKVPGNTPRPSFIPISGDYPYTHNIYFETPDTAVKKLNFLRSIGVRSVIVWELTNDTWADSTSITKALYKNSGNPEIRPALPSKSRSSLPQELIGIFEGEWSKDTRLSQPALHHLVSTSDPDDLILSADEQLFLGVSGTPALAVYDDTLFCIREGRGQDGWLWCATFDGQNWTNDHRLKFGTSGPPALVVYDGKLFCFHEGQGQDGWIWCVTFDGQEWSNDVNLFFGTGSRRHGYPSIAVAVYQDKLFCIHEGQGEDGLLWCVTFDGKDWSNDVPLPNRRTSSGPALAVVGNLLVCMNEGPDENGWLRGSYFTGEEWSWYSDFLLYGNRYGTSGPPALLTWNDKLFCIHEGRGEDGYIWSFNNEDGSDHKLVGGPDATPLRTSRTPAIAAYNNTAVIIREGPREDGYLRSSTLQLTHKIKKQYNLLMPDRPSAPYQALDRYNIHLTAHQALGNKDYPVEVMRHHIIPYSRLRDFWNQVIDRSQHSKINGFLHALETNLDQYHEMSPNLTDVDRGAVKALLADIRSGLITHNESGLRPPGFDSFASVYAWLPGNLFVGPKGGGGDYQRTDDPGEDFEANAYVITGNAKFDQLNSADRAIQNYLGEGYSSRHAAQANVALSQVAQKRSIYALKSNNWVYAHTRYRIRLRRDEL